MRGPVGDYFHDGHGVSDQQHIGEKVQTTGLTDAAVDQLKRHLAYAAPTRPAALNEFGNC